MAVTATLSTPSAALSTVAPFGVSSDSRSLDWASGATYSMHSNSLGRASAVTYSMPDDDNGRNLVTQGLHWASDATHIMAHDDDGRNLVAQSCIATMLAYLWFAIHRNIPAPKNKQLRCPNFLIETVKSIWSTTALEQREAAIVFIFALLAEWIHVGGALRSLPVACRP